MTTVSIAVPAELASRLPSTPSEQREVLELGIRQWRVRQALKAYSRGEGSLAYAAEQAGVSLREIVPLAYAHGLEPPLDPEAAHKPLTPRQPGRLKGKIRMADDSDAPLPENPTQA